MNLENLKVLFIGTAIAFSGGLLRVLISIQNKERKKIWEHIVTLLIVVIVGFTMSFVMHKANVDDKWYSTGVLFVLGYGYDKFLKMITTNFPSWVDRVVNAYIEKTYGVKSDKQTEVDDRDTDERKIKKTNRKYGNNKP
jgi:L-cystine uptake protein TcyP (sodium:dicarboxylate symporter family)